MSHVVKLEVRIREPEVFVELAREEGLEVQVKEGEVVVDSPSFYRPVKVSKSGEIICDYMDRKKVSPLIQAYVEKIVERKLREKGYSLMKREEKNGTKVLVFAGK